MRRVAKCSAVALLISLVVTGIAPAGSPKGPDGNSNVIPPQTKHRGLSYAQWSARQWQWLFSVPVNHHPLFENADCSAGQSGNVWFLGGTYASSEVEPGVILGAADRECHIPSGTSLFFPIVAVETSEVEGYGSSEAELRGMANFLADFIVPESVFLEIDGEPVADLESFRVESPLFTFGPLPADNVEEASGYVAPEGTTSPAVSDGYFAMVKPLSVGTHTLHFGGVIDVTGIGGPLFIQDIKYTITVVPRRRY